MQVPGKPAATRQVLLRALLVFSAAWCFLPAVPARAATRYDGDGIVIPWCEVLRWYVNRARYNPEAEADRLSISNATAGGHPNYDVCEDRDGGNDFGTTTNQWAPWAASMQPLAPNDRVRMAASNHCEDMYSPGPFQHPTPAGSPHYTAGWGSVQREAQEGYVNDLSSGMFENIAYNGYWNSGGYPPDCGVSPETFHSTWFTDYGEIVRGHRRAILNDAAREIGIGYYMVRRLDLPYYYYTFEYSTEDFTKHGNDRFFTDTVFYDKNANGVYARGEGVGNVEIRLYDGATEAAWYDVSGASGSFAVPTTNLAAGRKIDVVLINKTGMSTNLTIPRSYSSATNVFLTNNQSCCVGSYIQGGNNTGFRNLQWITNLTITASAGPGGSISPAGAVNLAMGDTQAFTIAPTNAGYYITNVLVDGASVGAVTSYTFSFVTTNHTISAFFARVTNTISASAGPAPGGSISPSGSVLVAYGASQAFTVSSNTGYRVVDVKVDGVSTGAVSSYTFTNVTNARTISVSFAVITNTIYAGATEGGRISPSGAVNVAYGATQVFNVATNPGGYITNVFVDGAPVGAVTSYTFSNVTARHSITATFGIVTYTISASAGPDGTISPSGAVSVTHGGSQAFSIAGNTGRCVANVLVDGISVGAVTSYTFSAVTTNRSISATFAVITNTIYAGARPGGSISPSGAVKVAYGNSQGFNIYSNAGHFITNVIVDGVPQGVITAYTFTNVSANHSITSLYGTVSNTITATAGPGGSISPSGSVQLAYGDSQNFDITPLPGRVIAEVVVDGVPQGIIESYLFSNVTNSHSISASFAVTTNIITATASPGGSISPSGSVGVTYNGSQSFLIASNAGYRLVNVVVDGLSQGVVTSYTFYNVTAPCAISAYFALVTNTITATAGPGGSISPSGAVGVGYGGSQSFNFYSNFGYCVTNVLVDGASVGAVASYTFTNVTRSRTIAAFFGVAPDGDGDGMTDSWEARYFTETNSANGGPDDDWDGDGTSNLKEYIAGTNPTNETSTFDLRIDYSTSSILVRVGTIVANPVDYGTSVRHYRMEQVSDLVGTWSNVTGYTDFAATGEDRVLTNGAPASPCFYRARVWLEQ